MQKTIKIILITSLYFLSLSADAKDYGDYYSKSNVAARVAEKKLELHKKSFSMKQFSKKSIELDENRMESEKAKDFMKTAKYHEISYLAVNGWALYKTNMIYLIGDFKKTNKDYLAASPIQKVKLHHEFWLKHSIIDWDFWMQRCIDIAGNQYYEKEVVDYNQTPSKKYPYKAYSCFGQSKNTNVQTLEVYQNHKKQK